MERKQFKIEKCASFDYKQDDRYRKQSKVFPLMYCLPNLESKGGVADFEDLDYPRSLVVRKTT